MILSLTKILKISLGLTLSFWSFFLIFPNLAQSNSANQGYVPPAKDQKQQKATASGSRGCSNQPIDIVPIIPTDHTATTVSTRPNFLFFLKHQLNLPVNFTLVEPGIVEPLWEEKITINQSGILLLSLPPSVNLEVDKVYVWNFEVTCNLDRPSENWYIRAAIKRVIQTTELKRKLAAANSEFEKAVIFANNGIWYDAITTSYNGRDKSSSSYFEQLLVQIGLSLP